MRNKEDMSWKYIFFFAGNWNQFREWIRRAGYDEELLKKNGVHIVYADTYRKVWGYSPEVYKGAEYMVIGTFYEEASKESIEALEYLKMRIDQTKA